MSTLGTSAESMSNTNAALPTVQAFKQQLWNAMRVVDGVKHLQFTKAGHVNSLPLNCREDVMCACALALSLEQRAHILEAYPYSA